MCIDGVLSDPSEIEFGLPQGSIVGPSMFSIYTIPLGNIIRQFGISFHMYADDIQLHISFNPKDHRSTVAALDQISQCIKAIKIWMNNNMLKLNNEKTEFMVIASKNLKRFMSPVSLLVEVKTILPADSVRNLGVAFDSQMSMSMHVKTLFRSLTFQIPNISRIRRFLDFDTCHLIVHALILSRLDYGNGLLLGSNHSDIQKWQRIQNWAAKLICKATKRDHASPYLRELQWLPVEDRITFKIMVFVFKCLNGMTPEYLSSSLSRHRPACAGLRSASDSTRLSVHNTTKTFMSAEKHCFSYTAPQVWNNLPVNIKDSQSLMSFTRTLKTNLYSYYFA